MSIPDELVKLADLREKNILTEAEFQAAKARTLSEAAAQQAAPIPDIHEVSATFLTPSSSIPARTARKALILFTVTGLVLAVLGGVIWSVGWREVELYREMDRSSGLVLSSRWSFTVVSGIIVLALGLLLLIAGVFGLRAPRRERSVSGL